jgi:hypothetical protein
MRRNLLEGFGQWLTSLNIDPKYGADMPLLIADLEIIDNGRRIKYPGLTLFNLVDFSKDQRWAKIKDVSYPDPHNKDIADFPSGISPSQNAGRTYLLSGKDFDRFIAPRLSPQPEQPTGGV